MPILISIKYIRLASTSGLTALTGRSFSFPRYWVAISHIMQKTCSSFYTCSYNCSWCVLTNELISKGIFYRFALPNIFYCSCCFSKPDFSKEAPTFFIAGKRMFFARLPKTPPKPWPLWIRRPTKTGIP